MLRERVHFKDWPLDSTIATCFNQHTIWKQGALSGRMIRIEIMPARL